MILITCALECEARPIIDSFKLKKTSLLDAFQVFKRDGIHLVITGVGSLKTATATTACLMKLAEHSGLNSLLVLNIGICGGSKDLKKGDVVFPHTILSSTTKKKYFQELLIKHEFKLTSLMTHEKPVNDAFLLTTDCADMEAYAFFHAANTFLNTSQIYCIKIVSDDCTGGLRDKNEISSMIAEAMPAIQNFISQTEKLIIKNEILTESELEYLEGISSKLNLTEYQRIELSKLAISYKIRNEKTLTDLGDMLTDIPNNKNESKDIFAKIQGYLNA